MDELDKQMILQLVAVVDEQHALIDELLKGYQPGSFDSAKAIATSVKSIRLKIENIKRNVALLTGAGSEG